MDPLLSDLLRLGPFLLKEKDLRRPFNIRFERFGVSSPLPMDDLIIFSSASDCGGLASSSCCDGLEFKFILLLLTLMNRSDIDFLPMLGRAPAGTMTPLRGGLLLSCLLMVDLLTISDTERVGMGGCVISRLGVCRSWLQTGLSGAFRGGAGGASPFKGSSEDFEGVLQGGFLPFLFGFLGDLEEERALRLSGLLSVDSDDLLPAVEPDSLEVFESEEVRAGAFRLGLLDASSS